MEIHATTGCGAEVSGVQLGDLDAEGFEAVRRAFQQYGVLFFRDQDLPPQAHIDVARRLGDIVVNKFFQAHDELPEIALVRKEKEQQTNIGGGWHADHSYDEAPAKGSILVARELPPEGGDTLFADLEAAYATLSDGLKRTLATLRAVHSNRHLYGAEGIYRKTDLADQLQGEEGVGDAIHPIVIRHPETGRPVLYVNPGHTICIEGWTVPESRALLDFLYQHVTQEATTHRFVWSPGAVAFWDNRRTWHLAMNDYQGHRRLMHRITLTGEPLGAVSASA
jgi:taurine dioxygenase